MKKPLQEFVTPYHSTTRPLCSTGPTGFRARRTKFLLDQHPITDNAYKYIYDYKNLTIIIDNNRR